jgi:hypothetical protein
MNELHNPSWAFRTVEGLADALGTSPDDVENVLAADPTLARWVPARDAQGRQLLTSAKKPPSGRERLISLRAFIAKTTY